MALFTKHFRVLRKYNDVHLQGKGVSLSWPGTAAIFVVVFMSLASSSMATWTLQLFHCSFMVLGKWR